MTLNCKQATWVSLATLSGHAAEPQRLELEEHLAGCARCAEQHSGALALVRGIAAVKPEELSQNTRDAVRQALITRAPTVRRPPARVPWAHRLVLGLVLAGAATAGIMFAVRPFWERPYQVISGDVIATSNATPIGPGGDRVVAFTSVLGGDVRLADAHVRLAGATEITWHESLRRLDLRGGRVLVDVEHKPGGHFQVRTPRFTVEVLGTRFAVDMDGVRTLRGVVRVIRADGTIAARVLAGQAWTMDAPRLTAPVAHAEEPAITTAPAPIATPPSMPVATRAPTTAAGLGRNRDGHGRQAHASPVAATLGEARRALARGDAPLARRIVSPLFQQGRDVGVEARVLFAESFLIEGRYADAIDGYHVVVRDFPGTNQAESAEFAIAQLDSEHGKRADARAALRGYLDRYPHGRFAREAADRLTRLTPRDR